MKRTLAALLLPGGLLAAGLFILLTRNRWLLQDATGRWWRRTRREVDLGNGIQEPARYRALLGSNGRDYTPSLQSDSDLAAGVPPLMAPLG
jgi:hypothetical protein